MFCRASSIHWSLIAVLTLFMGSHDVSPVYAETYTAPKHQEVITIAVHRYFPYYVDGVGLGADIYRAAFATQNIEVVLKEYPIMRGVSEMLSHRVDAFSPGTLFIRDQASLERVTTVASFIVNVGWLYKGDNNPLLGGDLTGTTLATPTPVQTPQLYYLPFLARGMRQLTVEGPDRQVRLVISEHADFAAIPRLTGWHKLVSNSPEHLHDYAFAPVMEPYECNLSFEKNNPRTPLLITAFKRGMKIIIENGTYLKIHEKYWGEGNVPKSNLFETLKSQGTNEFDSQLLLKAAADNK